MIKMIKLICAMLVIAISLNAETWTNHSGIVEDGDGKNYKNLLQDFISKLDVDHFVDSVEIDFAQWGTCSGSLGIPGIAGCYDEPIVMADYSTLPLEIQSIGVSLGTSYDRAGYSRRSSSSSNAFGHVNMIKMPLLGMIMDSKFMCFQGGDLALAYMSGFDPLYDGMFTRQMYADINAFFRPEYMMMGLIDCTASSTESFAHGLSAASSYNSRLRLSLPHYFGCWNSFPMGGWAHSGDPIVGAATSISFALASTMRVGGIGKTIRIKGLDGGVLPDTMCGEKITPQMFIKPQFLFQLVYPTASQTVPLGASSPSWAEFKNKPGAGDNSAFWVWKRKCLYLGAAECSK